MPRFEVSLGLRARFRTYCVTRVYGLGSLDLQFLQIDELMSSAAQKNLATGDQANFRTQAAKILMEQSPQTAAA